MAKTSDVPATNGNGFLAAFCPMVAMTAVGLTAAGHTITFREMDAARGWITAEGYSLHSSFLFAIALSLLAGPWSAQLCTGRTLCIWGLSLLAAGSFGNGLFLVAPLPTLVIFRVISGFGAGLVLVSSPRLVPSNWRARADWCNIVLPTTGPYFIAVASMTYGWANWEGAFLFEGTLALIALACVVFLRPAMDMPAPARYQLTYWPCLVVVLAGVWYVMHWGQLSGWLTDSTIFKVVLASAISAIVALWLIWPQLEPAVVAQAGPRLLFVCFAGLVQFFNVSEMGVYGALLVKYDAVQRSFLIVSVSLGAAAGLAFGRLAWSRHPPGRPGSTAGLLILAAGMAMAHHATMNWPFWSILNTVDLNWFAAPQYWQLFPARFLMGFGTSLVLLSELTRLNPVPEREARIKPILQAAQFVGGGLAVGFLSTILLTGHQTQYSYAGDRGFIQPQEVIERQSRVQTVLSASGSTGAGRQAEVLMFRSVNYEADNLLFAWIYGMFIVVALTLAAVQGAWMAWDFAGWLRATRRVKKYI